MSVLEQVCPKAAVFWAAHDMETLADGRYDLGDDEFVNVMTYTNHTRAAGQYEAHINYVDIQCVLTGQELIEVAPLEELTVTQEYSKDSDCALYAGDVAGEQYLMQPGRFCWVGPADAHMPGIALNDELSTVKKAVFKIKA